MQPDFRLSFQLKLYESIEKGDNDTIKQYMDTYRWINENIRNILDESDAILQPNYQLIYTLGNQRYIRINGTIDRNIWKNL